LTAMAQDDKLPVYREQISPPPLKRYYRMEEVALYFGISARTVYRLLDEGDLHVTRIRGCVRISAEELRRFEELLAETELF